VIADDLDVRLRQLHGSGKSVAHTEDALSGGPGRQMVVFERDSTAVSFQGMVKLHRGAEFAFTDRGGGRHRLVDLAIFLYTRVAHVGTVGDKRRIRLHRVVFLDDKGEG